MRTTLNIGTYKKEKAQDIRKQVIQYKNLRKQNLKVRFKSRGKGTGQTDKLLYADKVAIYIDIENMPSLPYCLKNKIINKLKEKIKFSEHEVLNGFEGLLNMNDEKLINLLINQI